MQKKKAVSLIVLIITIIVMIILAGTIILSLRNTGIVDKAQSAVDEANLKEVQTLASLKWAEAFMDGNTTQEKLQQEVLKKLSESDIDLTPYYITVTNKGVKVELLSNVKLSWRQEDLKVTNGMITMEIGDSIAYDETNGGNITGLTDVAWAVLGVNEQGQLLIMSTSDIKQYKFGGTLDKAKTDWLTGAEQLDTECEPYGKGRGAIEVRSIRAEDVDKVCNYDPVKDAYGKATVKEYNNEVQFIYNGTTTVSFIGSNGVKGNLTNAHNNGFLYYNGQDFVTINNLTTGTADTVYAKLKTTHYGYDAQALFELSEGQKGLSKDTKAYKMLFRNNNDSANSKYWLASSFIGVNSEMAGYGIKYVTDAGTTGVVFLGTDIRYGNTTNGIRPVVTLSPDIKITGSSETGWSF